MSGIHSTEQVPMPTHWRFQNLTGRKYGRWTVLYYVGQNRFRRTFWMCQCDCGIRRSVDSNDMKRKQNTSCGCYNRELTAKRNRERKYFPVGQRPPEYSVWMAMKMRCSNPKNKCYSIYGGRGISVCDRWQTSFPNFLADMGARPSNKHSIERNNTDGNYEPDNCRWATATEQAHNKSNNRWIEFQGRRLCITDWAKELGLSRAAIRIRLKKGWSVEDTLTIKSGAVYGYHRKKKLTAG